MIFGRRPGQTPLPDSSGLKTKAIKTMAQLHKAEAKNVYKATKKYFGKRLSMDVAAFDLSWTRQLHEEMFGEVWNWAGQFRTAETNLGLPPQQIDPSMQILLDNLHSWTGFRVNLIDQAARLHHGAVRIHPFHNGNGRWSRMLANIWLRLHKHPITHWPNDLHGPTSVIRAEYIRAVKAGDSGDLDPLTEMLGRYTVSA